MGYPLEPNVSDKDTVQPGRILLASEHCLCDPVSGAAISACELLALLQDRGWSVSALTGDKLDVLPNSSASPTLPAGSSVRRLGGPDADPDRLALHHLDWRGVPASVVRPSPQSGVGPHARDVRLAALPFLLDAAMTRERPDLLLTYGGGWCSRAILRCARKHGVPAVFWLRNTLYERPDLFQNVVTAIVPSQHTARHYREKFSPAPHLTVLYPSILRERVYCPVRQPKYLTFVSPMLEKGALFVARLVSELSRLRPDIEVLIVEGRGALRVLEDSGLTVLGSGSVRVQGRTDDPRQYLAVTRVLMVPSVWEEPFGRGVVEAMVNGIPVVASDRGGLPEVVGTGGLTLPLPSRLVPGAMVLPTAAEVKPWIDAIVRLWDDEQGYKELSRSAVASAARFDPDVLADHASRVFAGFAQPPRSAPESGLELFTDTGHPDPVAAASYWADLRGQAADLLQAD